MEGDEELLLSRPSQEMRRTPGGSQTLRGEFSDENNGYWASHFHHHVFKPAVNVVLYLQELSSKLSTRILH